MAEEVEKKEINRFIDVVVGPLAGDDVLRYIDFSGKNREICYGSGCVEIVQWGKDNVSEFCVFMGKEENFIRLYIDEVCDMSYDLISYEVKIKYDKMDMVHNFTELCSMFRNSYDRLSFINE